MRQQLLGSVDITGTDGSDFLTSPVPDWAEKLSFWFQVVVGSSAVDVFPMISRDSVEYGFADWVSNARDFRLQLTSANGPNRGVTLDFPGQFSVGETVNPGFRTDGIGASQTIRCFVIALGE
jgi:hypothetical protein